MGLAAVGHYRVMPGVTAGQLMKVSDLIGKGISRLRSLGEPEELPEPPEATQGREAA
jgi:hypothetical protein